MKRIITIAMLCGLTSTAIIAAERENTHLKAVTDSIAAEKQAYMETYAPEAPLISWTTETCAGNKDLKCRNADDAWHQYVSDKVGSQKLKDTMVKSPAASNSKAVQEYITNRTKEKKDYLQNHMPVDPMIDWVDSTCYQQNDLKCEKPNATWERFSNPSAVP